MVERLPDLDLVFRALGAAARRTILEDLKGDGRSISELAAGFDMSFAAVSKHVGVLERAGLVSRTKEGRVHRMHLRAGPLAEAVGYLRQYRDFWDDRFDALAEIVEADEEPTERGTT